MDQTRIRGMDIPVIRQVNGRAVLEALRTHGQMGHKEIAEVTNLSVPTVWRLVKELVKEGIVAEVSAPDNGSRGRKRVVLDIDSGGGLVAAVDVGGAHMKAVAMDLAGKVHDSMERDINDIRGEEAVGSAILSFLRAFMARCERTRGRPLAIGVSMSGTVDSQLGIIKLSFNLQLENFQIARILQDAFDVPVVVSNNIAASAIAESKIGHGRDYANFAYISVGMGIGAAYVFNHELYVNPSRGEFGLMVVAPEGDPNRFGGRGYLESLASGAGIAAAARRAIESGTSSLISELTPAGLAGITAKTVADAAHQGDALASDILARAANYLGIGIVNVANTLGLRLFIINGGVSKSGDVFWQPLREAVDKYEYWPGEVHLEPSMVREDSPVVGAGLLALEKVFEIAI